ncbi:hypothetical protein POTOM_026766 [Populus tomentosa]|uniref:Beta-galactosidase n=1 Tax=Populus tomentosa TaxID=118781 RepID=A0A8X7ZHG5_POPTO|nr:hypothetical protein POTOM_026766 [Populus tomentosa]
MGGWFLAHMEGFTVGPKGIEEGTSKTKAANLASFSDSSPIVVALQFEGFSVSFVQCRGFPVWLKYVPGISFRTDNEPFKVFVSSFFMAMQGFTEKIVGLMKAENLFESQGGPIILSQINTCNGFYCDSFAPNKPYKPTIWTEAWSGWFSEFGGTIHQRPVQDLAFAVAKFIQKGGSFINYYMVGVQTSQMEMLPTNGIFSWESYNEDISSLDDSSTFTTAGLLEQINVTRDASDYLWYMTSVDIGSSESFLHGGKLPTLIVQSTGHAVHIFINGQLSGSAFGTRENRRFTYTGKVNLRPGTNRIALLSVAVGLPNVGGHYESWNTGILGPVALHGLDQGKWDLSWQKWTYQVGLKGEAMNLLSPDSVTSVEWMQSSLTAQRPQPLTWHKAYFNAPEGDEPLALDMEGMGKGQIWINGQSVGRYWTAYASGNCNGCSYAGTFRPTKCQLGCGQPTQKWYHVPRSWLKPTNNLLVVFEELGGDPSRISLVKRSLASVCAEVSEFHPTIKNWQIESYGRAEEFHSPKNFIATLYLVPSRFHVSIVQCPLAHLPWGKPWASFEDSGVFKAQSKQAKKWQVQPCSPQTRSKLRLEMLAISPEANGFAIPIT